MPVIKPSGLLNGDRMAQLSDEARLYWPFVYAASNGYGRFRVDYLSILKLAFAQFRTKPDQETVRRILAEYRDSHLLFFYQSDNGAVWAAWDSASGQRYFSSEDKASPAPPDKQFQEWRSIYHSKKQVEDQEEVAADTLASSLFSMSTQKVLDFAEKTVVFSAEPPQTQTHYTQTHVLTHTQSLNTAQTRAREPEQARQPEDVPSRDAGCFSFDDVLGAPVEPPYWRALLFAADTAHLIYARGEELEFIRRRWGELDEAECQAAISGIEMRLKTGEYADAHFVPTLKRYVLDKRWTAKLRPGPQPRAAPVAIDFGEQRNQRYKAEFQERMERLMEERGERVDERKALQSA